MLLNKTRPHFILAFEQACCSSERKPSPSASPPLILWSDIYLFAWQWWRVGLGCCKKPQEFRCRGCAAASVA